MKSREAINVEQYRKRHEVEWSLERYKGVEDIDYVECKICGKRGLYIDKRHLKTRHGVTKEEYIEKFPNAIFKSEKKINIQKKNATGNKANLGKKFSKEHRKKISKTQEGKNNSFYGKTHSKKSMKKAMLSREKISMKKYGASSHMKLDHYKDLFSKIAANNIIGGRETYTKCSKSGHFYSKKNDKTFFYRSSYELKYLIKIEEDATVVEYNVEPFYIKYEYEGRIRRYIPDFLINNKKLVEIKPKFLSEDNKTIAKLNAGIEFAKENGYEFKVIFV